MHINEDRYVTLKPPEVELKLFFYRFLAWYGRHTTNLAPFDLSHDEVEAVVKLGPQHPGSAFPAMYTLLMFDVSQLLSPTIFLLLMRCATARDARAH